MKVVIKSVVADSLILINLMAEEGTTNFVDEIHPVLVFHMVRVDGRH